MRPDPPRGWLLLPAILLFACFIGCSGYVECIDMAEEAVGDFHVRYNASEFEAIADAAHPDSYSIASRDEMVEILATMRGNFGRLQRNERDAWNVNVNRGVTTVTLGYACNFDSRDARERFVLRVEDGAARILEYQVNHDTPSSPDAED